MKFNFKKSIGYCVLMFAFTAGVAHAQWTNRYTKVDGFNHHVYLEGHEFPILSSGPVDPAASPDGEQLAFAHAGWIWVLDLEDNTARRITDSAAVDSRPRWSPDSRQLAFVRDDGADTSIVVLSLRNNRTTIINTPTIELDPEFSADGNYIYYTSGEGGTLNIWRRHLSSGDAEQVTDLSGVERNPRFLADGSGMVYLHLAGFSKKDLRFRSFTAGTDTSIQSITIAALVSADVHPQENAVVYGWPSIDDYRIRTADMHDPVASSEITTGTSYAYSPSWSADGDTIYFVTPDENQQFHLMQVPAYGGEASEVEISEWDWGERRARIRVRTTRDGAPSSARLSVLDRRGHPVVSEEAATYFDSQNGEHYFYSDGEVELAVPAGAITIKAVNGLMTTPTVIRASATARGTNEIDVPISSIWDASGEGYASADFHFHLNYDGPYRQVPADIAPLMDGENLDVGAPLTANLHNRLMDKAFLADTVDTPAGGHVRFGQEVRSHFHGHIGVVGAPDFYYPWHWGPGYPRLGNSDLSNAQVLSYTKDRGGLATYVHPIATNIDPFDDVENAGIPLEVISDGILNDELGLEIVCAWTDELGTSALWYRFLNLGKPVVAMAGTDMFVDFHRTPAVGAARVYAESGNPEIDWNDYLENVREGRSFVTNAPALLFEIGGSKPGDTVDGGAQSWTAKITSAIAVEKVELVVNGDVVWTGAGIAAGETRTINGDIELPSGGWVAMRAHGGETSWPAMDSYPFAHTSPVWIGSVGSTEPSALAAAKADLMRALDSAETRALDAYGDTDIATFKARIGAARAALAE